VYQLHPLEDRHIDDVACADWRYAVVKGILGIEIAKVVSKPSPFGRIYIAAVKLCDICRTGPVRLDTDPEAHLHGRGIAAPLDGHSP
jgi:hypothetical protein